MTLPFQVARQISNNLGEAFQKSSDQNAIDRILSESMASGDPAVLQQSIGQILSQVSPERQGMAVQFLQGRYSQLQEQQQRQQQSQRESEAGLVPGINPTAQAAIYKESQKGQRLQEANKAFAQPFTQAPQVQGESAPGQPISGQQQPSNAARKQQLLQLTGHPDMEVRNRAIAELRNIQEEEKSTRADLREIRKETLPLKENIIKRADAARASIRNKSHLLDIIDRGDLNDPTYAIFAESLPFNLGKRLLSEDTVEYKGGLVDDFSDLKNIFTGATRVKEIDLYENKLADTYLTDSQKKAILKSRINTSKVELIREEAAQEVEDKHPNISALKFNKKVEELAKPKIDALFNSIWDEQKAILDQAEARKKIPLDINDPEDVQIMKQILQEAGNNKSKALELARKRGYSFR